MDNTAGVSCGRITETEHAIEGIRGDMKILRRRTDEIEEGHKATTNKIMQEKRQNNHTPGESEGIEAQNRVLNYLQTAQAEGQQILLMANNGEGSTDSNLQAKLHTVLQQNNYLKGEQDKLSAELGQQKE